MLQMRESILMSDWPYSEANAAAQKGIVREGRFFECPTVAYYDDYYFRVLTLYLLCCILMG